jgi:hypothetical protein
VLAAPDAHVLIARRACSQAALLLAAFIVVTSELSIGTAAFISGRRAKNCSTKIQTVFKSISPAPDHFSFFLSLYSAAGQTGKTSPARARPEKRGECNGRDFSVSD